MGLSDFRRPEEGRLLGGVCAGLAWQLGLDATLLRLAMMLLGLTSGVGVLLYLVLWLVVPAEGRSDAPWRQVIGMNLRGMGTELREAGAWLRETWHEGRDEPWPVPLSRRWVALVLLGGGVLILLVSLDALSWLGPARAVGLAAVALGAAVLISRGRGGRR